MSDRTGLFQERIGYRFANAGLLERALTHASHGDGRNRAGSNERLEFLGDRVLGLLAAERLFDEFEGLSEGGLAQRLNALVNREACARAARACDLGEALRLSPAEDRLGGRDKPSILADACEAVMGALYLDGGVGAARAFFERYWADQFKELGKRPIDAKSQLQEWAASRRFPAPIYTVIDRHGPDHKPRFTVQVSVGELTPAKAEGGSKQDAQRCAAEALLAREVGDGR